MAYNANTNWNNERSYLNGLVNKGGGNGEWAKNQLKELDRAQQQYGSSSGGSTGGSTNRQQSTGGSTGRQQSTGGGSAAPATSSTPNQSTPSAAQGSGYNASTNWANENSYLNGLIAKGGGTGEWAKKQLQELQAAQKKYTGGTGTGAGLSSDEAALRNRYFPGADGVPSGVDLAAGTVRAPNGDILPLHDWSTDTIDYGQLMRNARDIYEFREAAQARVNKANAQGIDITGKNGTLTNEDLYNEWRKKTGYAPNYGDFMYKGGHDSITDKDGWIDNAGQGTGYYGMDGEGHWGYYEDAALTKKLAKGTWDDYASSDGGYVRMDSTGQPDMTERDLSRAGKTVTLTGPKGTWECTYNDNGYITRRLRTSSRYTFGLTPAKADNDAGVSSEELMNAQFGHSYTGPGSTIKDKDITAATRKDYASVMAGRSTNGGSAGSGAGYGAGSGSAAGGNAASPQSGGSSLPGGFIPSAAGVTTNNDYQEALREKMNENSRLWFTADAAEKERLHQENVRLAEELNRVGGNVSYDPVSGKWSGASGTQGDDTLYPSGGAGSTPTISGLTNRAPDLRSTLDKWLEAAKTQLEQKVDYATSQGVNELQRAQEDAQGQFQTQRNQIAADEARASDNQALYNERTGDRGGIGAAQYDQIANTAAQNRLTVNQAQTKLSTDTARQIADLRAQGEFTKADQLLQLSQNYLQQLISIEQWSAEFNLSVDQFNKQIEQWNYEYELKVADLLGSYRGQQTLAGKQYELSRNSELFDQEYKTAGLTGTFRGQPTLEARASLAEAGLALAQSGIMPSQSQLEAMKTLYGYDSSAVTSLVQTAKLAAQSKLSGGSGYKGGSSGGGKTNSSEPNIKTNTSQWLAYHGYDNYTDAYDALRLQGFDDDIAKSRANAYMKEINKYVNANSVTYDQYQGLYRTLVSLKQTKGTSTARSYFENNILTKYVIPDRWLNDLMSLVGYAG